MQNVVCFLCDYSLPVIEVEGDEAAILLRGGRGRGRPWERKG